MNIPEVEFRVNSTKLSPSEGLLNSVIITVDTKSDEILENPTNGHRILTGRSTRVCPSILINFNLRSCSHDHILSLLHNQHQLIRHRWLCLRLASKISKAATEAGFGRNGFFLTMNVKITYQNVVVMSVPPPSNDEALSKRIMVLRMVLLGRIGKEALKSLKMETEPCSICLDNLSGSKPAGVPTRMTCSHVFHDRCLLEWLKRKNTCPLCRTVLYDR